MLELTKTFKSGGFSITPIMMGKKVIFLPAELAEQLEYTDLSSNIRHRRI